jgi:hypothetical protein
VEQYELEVVDCRLAPRLTRTFLPRRLGRWIQSRSAGRDFARINEFSESPLPFWEACSPPPYRWLQSFTVRKLLGLDAINHTPWIGRPSTLPVHTNAPPHPSLLDHTTSGPSNVAKSDYSRKGVVDLKTGERGSAREVGLMFDRGITIKTSLKSAISYVLCPLL